MGITASKTWITTDGVTHTVRDVAVAQQKVLDRYSRLADALTKLDAFDLFNVHLLAKLGDPILEALTLPSTRGPKKKVAA